MLAERSPQSGVGEWAGSSAAHGQSAAAPATDAPGAPASSTPAAGAPKLRTSSGGGGGGGSSSFTMPDPTKFTSPADVSAALRSLSAHSASLDVQLAQKITHAVEPALKGAQQTVIGLEPTLDAIAAQVDGLKERFAVQARTADDISAELRKVAARRKRVSKALEWARQVQELKTALQLLVSCIERRDWDGAVTHCQAAMAIDPVILNSNFAAKVIPTSDFPDPPPHILLNMREELLRRFTVLFNTYARGEAPAASPRQEAPSATPSRDPEQATRFFKLFPQIGWREEGLQVYADFAGSLIRDYGKSLVDALGSSRSKDAPLPHPQLLTSLFEPMARLVSTHQPLVDKHYGDGEFARGVMPALQSAECDRLGLRILESWLEERTVARKLDEVRQYAFRYLTLLRSRPVQYTIRLNAGPGGLASGGLSGNHSGSASPIPGQGSGSGGPASTLRAAFPGITRPSTPLRSSTPQPGGSSLHARQGSEDDGATDAPDAREIDRLLNELAALASRCAVYRRFIRARFGKISHHRNEANGHLSPAAEKGVPTREELVRRHSSSVPAPEDEPDRAQVLLGQSKLLLEMEKLLRKVYVPMELWFLRISIEKAHRLDGPDPASAPLSTPLPDDVFYVVRAVLARILSTCPSSTAFPSSTVKSQAREVPVTGVEIVVVTLKAVEQMLVEDYLGVIQRRLQGVWIAASGMMSVDGPRKEAASREMRTMFVTYLNVLETSATYVDRLSREIASPQALLQTYTPEEVPVIIKQLQSIANLSVKFRAAAKTEMDLLFTQLVRPRFRPILLDAYRDVSYVLDDDSYAEAEYSDLVRRRFIKGWETVVVPYRNIFSEANYDAFIVTALEGLVRPWEKLVMGMRFTELGALRFDKDIRGLSTYLASQTAVGVRNKFARLQQISYVLSLDPHETEEEVYESGVTAGMVWSLLLSEIRAVKALRLQR
ncbi:Golgi transport complex subunit 4 [Tilletia horrida]|uniref:Conserved oligomeric Golgi complex subunit 4 n=1 Tax=Tilletia horrida TaxID=155126 RepID=A0AAN6GES3_9BASI|nr:Golgi transport complex subunit 4 [Tilletia horrida]